MLTVRKVPADEVLALLPDAQPLDIEAGSTKQFDMAVLPLGFEERAPAASERLAAGGVRLGKVLVPIYDANHEANEAQWERLSQACSKLCDQVPERHDVGPSLLNELRLRTAGESEISVLFDISGASNGLVMDVLWALLEGTCDITIAYTLSDTYLPERDHVLTRAGNLRKKPLVPEPSEGTGSLEIDLQHIGRFSETGDDLVVMIPGFDRDRSRKVINSVDAALLDHHQSRVYWILGEPLYPDDAWRTDYQLRCHKGAGCGSVPENVLRCSTFDYKQVVRSLEQIYQESAAGSRITISPMGSKMQAIGCAFFCLARPEVRVKFSVPEMHNTAYYSSGAGATFVLDLGSAAVLRRQLSSIGSLEILDGEGGTIFSGCERHWTD